MPPQNLCRLIGRGLGSLALVRLPNAILGQRAAATLNVNHRSRAVLGELPTRCGDIAAMVLSLEHPDLRLRKNLQESVDSLGRWRRIPVRIALEWVVRDEVYNDRSLREEVTKLMGTHIAVIDIRKQHIRNHDRAFALTVVRGPFCILIDHLHELVKFEGLPTWHNLLTEFLGRRVQGKCELHLWQLVHEPPHVAHNAHSRNSDAARCKAESLVVHEAVNRRGDRVKVLEGLAHSHEDDVGHRPMSTGVHELLLDFPWPQIPCKAHGACGAEGATQAAAHL
mmetsp:Transcript_129858/g.289728  ORF Transcript_129858/g.289728 Transcript_129858/m.289728 type:complete len:281 (-) Transcript_129858:463-1305(-)